MVFQLHTLRRKLVYLILTRSFKCSFVGYNDLLNNQDFDSWSPQDCPILESKGMGAIFQEKGKGMFKKNKILENLGKNVQNMKIFCTFDCMWLTARIGPVH